MVWWLIKRRDRCDSPHVLNSPPLITTSRYSVQSNSGGRILGVFYTSCVLLPTQSNPHKPKSPLLCRELFDTRSPLYLLIGKDHMTEAVKAEDWINNGKEHVYRPRDYPRMKVKWHGLCPEAILKQGVNISERKLCVSLDNHELAMSLRVLSSMFNE